MLKSNFSQTSTSFLQFVAVTELKFELFSLDEDF